MILGKKKKFVSFLLAWVLAFCNIPNVFAAVSAQETLTNLLAADMDTQFNGGISPFTVASGTSGGSQTIVQKNGNNALEFRDASLGTNLSSSFYYRLTSGKLMQRVNEIYSMPAGSSPVEFVFEYKLERTAASNKPVAKDIYAQIQFGNYDNNLIPRFPTGSPSVSISGTAAYLNDEPQGSEVLQTVNDKDIASYRFKVIPNGGVRKVSNIELAFSVRVDVGGTDEAYVVDDLAVYEVNSPLVQDTEAPTAPANLTFTAKTDTSVNLSWTASTDNVGVTNYDIYQNGILLATVSGITTTNNVIGLSPSTAYTFMVKARDGAGNTSAASNEVSVTTNPSANGLPVPFGDRDIGNVNPVGNASYNPDTGTFRVQGSGSDIWGTADAFHYVYQPWTGDGQIVARVSKVENGVAWTKPGVMIRGSLSDQSPYAMMAVTPANGVVFQDRLQSGAASTLTAGTKSAAPYWVKLVRVGNMISAYDSSDGISWSFIKKEAINLPETVYFGLAVTSHNTGKLVTAEFDNVNIGEVPPSENTSSPYPGTVESRKQWLWDKTKVMTEFGGLQLNITQYVAQILDGQNVAANLQKIDKLFQTYDAEQYKTVSKIYAYLMVGDQFSSTMKDHVRAYFAQYAYAKLPQTENLRMSNYTAGYLVGHYLPEVVDLNGKSGDALKSLNKVNIEAMIDAGVHKGWAEYESPEYTFMTYLCLNAIYQYTNESDLKQKVKMAMDVMWFEWANDWIDGTFISSTSRAKGDSVSASDPTWRGADHTALSWMYFGSYRAQQGIGDSDANVPSAYRPYLEYLGMVLYRGMSYTPPEMAIRIGQSGYKDYSSRKTNMQNSSGRNLKVYRDAYVKPTWGLSTEVTYNRVDNWIEDIPVALRWHSAKPNPLFRINTDQGDSTVGNYDSPATHRIMQDGKAAVGVFKLLNNPTTNYINAMFPDTGSIITRQEQAGWVFSDTGPMYFAFKMVKPYSWYYQTPMDPANKVKTNARLHPTNTLTYSYNILRSQADTNGWVIETADASEYADFASFKNAILNTTTVDSTHINDTNPRLIYKSLNGDLMDITFDDAAAAYNNTHNINNTPINYNTYKLFDTPWLQQEQNSDTFTATQGGEVYTYDFANWTITKAGELMIVPNSGFENGATSPDYWTDSSLGGSSVRTWDTVTSRTYGHSVKIDNAASADYGGWNNADGNMIAIQPGAAYTLRAWVRTNNVNSTDGANVGITYYKSDGTTVTGSTYFSNYVRGTSNWTQIEATATAPADAARIRFDLNLKGKGTAWFDDVELVGPVIKLRALTLSADKTQLKPGENTVLNLSGTLSDGKSADLSKASVIYSTSNSAVVTVDQQGNITAAQAGNAQVKATVTTNGTTLESAAVTITVDGTPLVTTLAVNSDLPDGQNGWYVHHVNLTLSANNNLFGVAKTEYTLDGGVSWQLYTEPVTLDKDSKYSYSYHSIDNAGNAEAMKTVSINLDSTAPTITGAPTTDANENGWYNTNVTVHFTCADALSGIAGCTQDTTLTAEGSNLSVMGDAADQAGNVASAALMGINIDKTAPVTTDDAPAGWVNKDVTLTLTASDSGSGIVGTYYTVDGGAQQQGASIRIAEEGKHAISYWSVDKAGNIETPHTVTVQIDKTAPILSVVLDKTVLWPPNHQMISVSASVYADDSLSGIASVVLTSITSSEPDSGLDEGEFPNDIQGAEIGTLDTQFNLRAERSGNGNGRIYTIRYTAIDLAGNKTNTETTVTVSHSQSSKQ
ncbi:OmpL47-type beta-barrel domain-containing protein [Paenibacillus alginolyticus]|uniref:Fibronectin type III domain-containing protein n=1 Tax=Paenibacillus alginolyticus TaxID=59839 RepID=A0ABT4GG01_9BACL|nr:fibronectin type III domain-containing protein [Paenibacillus alginolyticus]MCY9695120.1 fibronectin type III domain-containing protein [Paenibacillus alginolyticus]MEC0147947.1 fibronectin type III domain-containing protein [Paenibacillus alginolyticus]